ncbi:unnamed protein product, partial [Medioppia subpectinata]
TLPILYEQFIATGDLSAHSHRRCSRCPTYDGVNVTKYWQYMEFEVQCEPWTVMVGKHKVDITYFSCKVVCTEKPLISILSSMHSLVDPPAGDIAAHRHRF